MTPAGPAWRRCSNCKKPIPLGSRYLVCSVSTCNRKRTGLVFCSLPCWDAHLPIARHRDAWAVEKTAPLHLEPDVDQADAAEDTTTGQAALRRRVAPPQRAVADEDGADVLVVVTKVKKYIRDHSGLNTSDAVMPLLSDHLRQLCEDAIWVAREEGRRTVLDRDVETVLQRRAAGH